MTHFSEKLTNWYAQNKRDLPWRNTRDPYRIWLSEIILQQTRVDQGTAYYLKFEEAFPTVVDLARADNEKVMKLWQGLGYYSRARNLHTAAKTITDVHKGDFPRSHKQILELKGVGEYTAAAIASFAFGQPYAVVDGNVYRVISRVFGIKTPIDSSQGKKEFNEIAASLLDKKDPGTHNQAIMEFGALYCKPASPDCNSCIFNNVCHAYRNNEVQTLPVKEKKTKIRSRFFNYLVLQKKEQIIIRKRRGNDIWTNLYDFPLIETSSELEEEEFFTSTQWKELSGQLDFKFSKVSPPYKHILSHQHIFAKFWLIEPKGSLKKIAPAASVIVNVSDLTKYAVPRLIERYLQDASLI
jgi:A/G-specific adenine glycosylase